jgi:hypothetical protein
MDRYFRSNELNNIMTSGALANFVFKGNRNYVHGSDIYPAALRIANELYGRYPNEVMGTFHKKLKKQGIFRIRSGGKGSSCEDIYARFIFKLGERKYELVLNSSNQSIRKTRPYDEEYMLRSSEMSTKSIRMEVRSDYHYIEQIISMTKRLHHVVYSEVHEKWLFTRFHIKDRIDPDDYQESVLEIRAERKLQNMLSQCSIFANNSLVGHIFFTAIRDRKEP